MRPDWNQYFMLMAKQVALRSGCNSRKNGAIIVKNGRMIASGYNGSVAGTQQCTDMGEHYCYRRDNKIPDSDKYNHCPAIHAEQNALNQAAEFGISVHGGIMYQTLQPCIVCLKNIAQVGIKHIFYELTYVSIDNNRDSAWFNKMKEYGIEATPMCLVDHMKEIAIDNIKGITARRRLISQ